ncbi:MAG: hypothetical protein WD066_10435 [Planctomycetaceae bacterium]
MSLIHPESRERARRYAERYGRTLVGELGWGKDGIVFETNGGTAIKALKHLESYINERNVYIRLFEREISDVNP